MTDAWIQAIGSVGFPIVCCAALFWMLDKRMTELMHSVDKLGCAIAKLAIKAGQEVTLDAD